MFFVWLFLIVLGIVLISLILLMNKTQKRTILVYAVHLFTIVPGSFYLSKIILNQGFDNFSDYVFVGLLTLGISFVSIFGIILLAALFQKIGVNRYFSMKK